MDVPQLENLHNIIAHDGKVELVCINKENGENFASFGEDFQLNFWQIGSNKPKITMGPFKSKITAMTYSNKESWFICGNNEGTVQIFDLRDSRCLYQWIVHKSAVTCVCAHPSNNSIVLSGGGDGKLLLLSTQMRRPLQIFNAHKGRINQIAISADGRYAATAGNDKTVKVFELTSTRQIASFDAFTEPVLCVAFHQYRPLICCSGKEMSVRFFDVNKKEEIKADMPLDSAPITVLSFQGEEGLVFSGSNDYLKVVGFDPPKLYDTLELGFDCLNDFSINDVKITIASSSGDRILIDRVRKDLFKPYIFSPVAVLAIGKGEMEIAVDVKPKTPRLLDMNQVRPLSTATMKRLNLTPPVVEKPKKPEETGIFHFKTSSFKKKAKVDRPEFEQYQKNRDESMMLLTGRYNRLCSINDLITSLGVEETIRRVTEREDLMTEMLNIIRMKPDVLTMDVAPAVVKIAGIAFIENPELSVSVVETVLQMFGAQYIDLIDNGGADTFIKELTKLQPMLRKAKNGYESYSESAGQILDEYGKLFTTAII